MSFQIRSLPAAEFTKLFHLSSDDLASVHALRTTADKKPGYPCRVSLADAEIGESLILVHYEHQQANSPFRASHAIYVRENAVPAELAVNQIPIMLRSRVLSLRGFDLRGMMIAADLVDGTVVESGIEKLLADSEVAYIQVHFAKPGCYAARVDRA